MEKHNILAKVNYSHNQNNACVLIKQFLIAQANGEKVLLLKMQNNFSQRINSVKFKIFQLNSKGTQVQESIFEYNNFQASPNAIFVPYKSIVLDKDCVNIKAELLKAEFDKYTFDKDQVKAVETKKEVSKPTVENRIEPDFYIKERKPKVPKFLVVFASLVFAGISVATFIAVDAYKNSHFDFSIDDFDYHFVNQTFEKDGDIVLTKYHGNAKNVKIPNKVLEHNIIAIDDEAFKDSKIEKVIIETELDSFKIGNDAFLNCEKLKSIELGKTVEIGENAFKGCSSLEVINSKHIKRIDDKAFAYSGIKSIKLEGDATLSLGSETFLGCDSLKSVRITQSVDFNHNNASFLSGCNNVEDLYLVSNGSLDGKESFSISRMFNYTNNSLNTLEVINVQSYCDYFCKGLPISSLTIGNVKGTSIGSYAFYECKNLSNIPLPKTVKEVYDYAFAGTQIDNFDFSNTEYIGAYAFANTNILQAKLNSNIKTLSEGLFAGCEQLTDVSLENNVETIPNSLFKNCSSLINIDIDLSNVKSIGDSSFEGCSSLNSFEIPSGVTFIGDYAFKGCLSVEKFDIPENVKEISNGSFANCTSLTSINFASNDITSIGDYVFEGCTSLQTIDLSEFTKLQNLGAYTFSDCKNLYDVKLPTECGLSSLNDGLFKNCKLQSFEIPSYIIAINKEVFSGCEELKSITFHENVQNIGNEAFSFCKSLEIVEIPNSVNYIGYDIFNKCNNLKELVIPFASYGKSDLSSMSYLFGSATPSEIHLESITLSKATQIANNGFEGYESIKTIITSEDLVYVGVNAFSACSSLEKLVLGPNVYTIGNHALKGCTSLKELEIPFIGHELNNNTTLHDLFALDSYSVNNSLESIKLTNSTVLVHQALSNFAALKNIDLGEKMLSVESYAFSNCTSLESIVIPSTVTYIDNYIFEGCSSLKDVSIPFIGYDMNAGGSLSQLFGYEFFQSNTIDRLEITAAERIYSYYISDASIKEIVLGDSVKEINSYAFVNIRDLKTIVIPNSVTNMENYTFSGCNDLQSITVPFIGRSRKSPFALYELLGWGDRTNLKYIEVTDTKKLSNNVFEGCTGVEKIVLNEGISIIPSGAFMECYSLYDIVLPESVVTIESSAFSNCKHLNEITIPKNVRTIGNYAFSGCEALYSVRNKSQLDIILGDYGNGSIAAYAYEVLKDDEPSSLIYHEQDDFKFLCYNNEWRLVKCFSEEKEISLIETIEYEGQKYDQYAINDCLLYAKSHIEKIEVPKSVTKLGYAAFRNMKSLKEVKFSKDCPITILPNEVFCEDSQLEMIQLPDGIVEIGSNAFGNCSSLKSFTVGKNVTSIYWGAFSNCVKLFDVLNLSNLDIQRGSTEHGEVAFYALIVRKDESSSELKYFEQGNYTFAYSDDELFLIKYNNSIFGSVSLPETVTIENKTYDKYKIQGRAFQDCQINELHIPNAVTYIGEYAFYNCYSLNKITCGDNVNLDAIERYAFSSCGSLSEIGNFKSINKIGEYAFAWCTNLSVIPEFNQIEFIGNHAFYYCTSLKKVILPKTLSTIEYNAFYDCHKLLEVVDLSPNLDIQIGSTDHGYVGYYALVVSTSKDGPSINYYKQGDFEFINYGDKTILTSFVNSTGQSQITLPKTVTIEGKEINNYVIGREAFKNVYAEKITIPSSVTEISEGAFRDCYQLSEVVFEQGSQLSKIGPYAFSNCQQLRSFTIPSSVTEIGEYAFAWCTRLIEVTIGEKVNSISEYAFDSTYALSVIYNNSDLSIDFNSSQYRSLTKGVIKIYGKGSEHKNIPTYDMGNVLFAKIEGDWYLIFAEIYDSTWIMPETISFGNETITQYIVSGDIFNYQYSINSVVIPTSVTKIQKYAFSDLYYFNYIYYRGNQQQWESLIKEDDSLLSKTVYYYAECIHNDNEWNYDEYGNINQFANYIDWIEKTPATCFSTGEEEGYCNACNSTVSRVIPTLSHEYENDICIKCGTPVVIADQNSFAGIFINDVTYPFVIDSEGVITSTMKQDNGTASLIYKATGAVTISFKYKTSSESGCDKLTIMTNINNVNSQYKEVSGETSYKSAVISLNDGDSISFVYSKDGSVSNGQDCCYIMDFTIK